MILKRQSMSTVSESTPELEIMVLPEVEYPPEAAAFIAELTYSFPASACCGH